MNTLMFFYTLAILLICIVTAVLSLAAYASSRRRFFIYGSGVFIGSVRPELTSCPVIFTNCKIFAPLLD